MLKLHELLHRTASMQRLSVVLLACIDSSLWLQRLVTSVAALEAVLEVLKNDYGFEEEVEEAEAVQGQEAAWAVLAAVSRHLISHECQIQVMLAGNYKLGCCVLDTILVVIVHWQFYFNAGMLLAAASAVVYGAAACCMRRCQGIVGVQSLEAHVGAT